jgi:hypothetical protein
MRTTDRVEYLLKLDPKTRNSDKELIVQYLQRLGCDLSPRQIDIIKSVNFESIRRERQKLQARGLYQADKQIKRERDFKSYRVQQTSPTYSPEQIGKMIQGSLV